MMCRLTRGVLRMLRLGSGILAFSPGQSSSCSGLETKTEPANEKINPESAGIQSTGLRVNPSNDFTYVIVFSHK
jgi:hypothetical protein